MIRAAAADNRHTCQTDHFVPCACAQGLSQDSTQIIPLLCGVLTLEHVQNFALRVWQNSGICHTMTYLRSVMYLSSLLGGITLALASYTRLLMENASYLMLLSLPTLPPTPLALMKLIGTLCLLICTYQLTPGFIFSSYNLIVERISNFHHIPTLLQKTVNTCHSLKF